MYQKAIVTFIDVLGFRDLIKNKDASEIKTILSKLTRFATPEEEDDEDNYHPKTRQFSDAIIRIRPVDTGPNVQYQIGVLFHELIDLIHAQGELVQHGILLRGGISYGEIYYDDQHTFGPALVTSYELESKYAIYPRVVLSPELIVQLKSNPLFKSANNSLKEEIKYIKNSITQGDDGIWYVDYLRAIFPELDDPEKYPDFLVNHKNIILKNAPKHNEISSVIGKYLWLSKYHNSVVSELRDVDLKKLGYNKSDLLITQNEFSALQELSP